MILLSASAIYLLYLYNQEKNRVIEAINQKIALEQDMETGNYITVKEAEERIELAKNATSEEYLNEIRSMMENGDGTLAMLETFYPNNIVVPDSGRYYFFDISETLAKNIGNITDIYLRPAKK